MKVSKLPITKLQKKSPQLWWLFHLWCFTQFGVLFSPIALKVVGPLLLSTGSSQTSISTLLVQGATSFSSLSSTLNSAMDSAERLIEDLESYIHNHLRNGVSTNSTRDGNVTATDSTPAAFTSHFSRNVDTTADIGLEIQTTDSNI